MFVVSGGETLPLLCFEEEKPRRNFLLSIRTYCIPLLDDRIRIEWIQRRVVLQSVGWAPLHRKGCSIRLEVGCHFDLTPPGRLRLREFRLQ